MTVDLIRWTHRLSAAARRRLWESFPNVQELEPPTWRAFLDGITRLIEDAGHGR